MNGFEAFNVERATHHVIGDRLFVVLEGFIGTFQGKERPRSVAPMIMQYEVRHVTVPLSMTTLTMMSVRDGDRVWIKYVAHDVDSGDDDGKAYRITEAY